MAFLPKHKTTNVHIRVLFYSKAISDSPCMKTGKSKIKLFFVAPIYKTNQ